MRWHNNKENGVSMDVDMVLVVDVSIVVGYFTILIGGGNKIMRA